MVIEKIDAYSIRVKIILNDKKDLVWVGKSVDKHGAIDVYMGKRKVAHYGRLEDFLNFVAIEEVSYNQDLIKAILN